MKTDLDGKDFQEMLAGEKGIAALDVARDLQELLADNTRLSSDLEKWQTEAGLSGDKITLLIDEKTALEEKHTALKIMLAELAK